MASDSMTPELASHCDLLRSLHRPGDPLLLPNAWDVATAKAVVAAGFPVYHVWRRSARLDAPAVPPKEPAGV